MMPGSPATPTHPPGRRAGYLAIGILLALAGGLSNGLLVANLPQIQGSLALTPVEGAWLTAAYSMTNVCMSLLLIKFRQQFGSMRFVRAFLPAFAIISLLQLFVRAYGVELLLRGASGIVGSALSTVSLFYMIQAVSAKRRLSALVLGVGAGQLALPLARAISPVLLQGGDVENLYVFELALSMLSLVGVSSLRLPPSEQVKSFEALDFITFALFAPGMALLCGVLAVGRVAWWSTWWIGAALAVSIALLTAAMLVEYNRASPLLNTRWMASSQILLFFLLGSSVRLLLSEQGFGTPGFLAVVGMGQEQLVALYSIVSLATGVGLILSFYWIDPRDLLRPIVGCMVLIAIGADMDAHATNLTRPENFYLSQALISFAAVYFMGPTMLLGILRALAKGPNHLVSFSAVFGISQTLGGLAGSALLGSFQIVRERFHSNELAANLVSVDPLVSSRLIGLAAGYGRVVVDPSIRQVTGITLFGQQLTREANILAFNDVFLVVAILATLTFFIVGARWLHFRVRGINPVGEELAALSRQGASRA